MEENKSPEQNNEEVIGLLTLTNQIKQDHEDMKRTIENFRIKSTDEIEDLKESRIRHLPMQKIVNDYLAPTKITIERAEKITNQLYEGLKDFQRINPKLLSDQITGKIYNNLARLLAEVKTTEEKKHHHPDGMSQQLSRNEEGITHEIQTRKELTKLVIIPEDKSQAHQINQYLREEKKQIYDQQ